MNYFGPVPQFTFGDVVYNAGGRLGPREQENLQLVYLYTGEANIWVDGHLRHLGPCEVTLLLPGHREEFRFSTTSPTHHGWCEAGTPKLEDSVRLLYERLPVALPFSKRMMNLAELGLPLRDDSHPNVRPLHDALAQAMFFEFFRLAGLLDTPSSPLPEPLRRARVHIEQRYAQPCDLALLGEVAGITPAHLIRLFRQHLATTPIEFLWRTRVEAARQLLAQSGLSIAEIAYRTGFQSPYHFSRLFRKHLRQPPREYRRAAWAGKGGQTQPPNPHP